MTPIPWQRQAQPKSDGGDRVSHQSGSWSALETPAFEGYRTSRPCR
jgi:hypothetical protein